MLSAQTLDPDLDFLRTEKVRIQGSMQEANQRLDGE
jgi:hypothetical protein